MEVFAGCRRLAGCAAPGNTNDRSAAPHPGHSRALASRPKVVIRTPAFRAAANTSPCAR
jgi:hypothetical protein